MTGREILLQLKKVSGETSDTYSYQSAKIKNSSLNNGIHFYEMAIKKFLGNTLISRLEQKDFSSYEDIKKALKPDTKVGSGEWLDISGLIAPKSEVDKLIDKIEECSMDVVQKIQLSFDHMYKNYYNYEWTWAYERMIEFYNLNAENITIEDIIRIIKDWKNAVIDLDRLVYADAKKEFSLSAMTGFGVDGTRKDKEQDFEQVRGDFDSNEFVSAILNHIKVKTVLGDNMINKIMAIV